MESKPKQQHLIVQGQSAKEMCKEIYDSNHPCHLAKEQLDEKRAKFKPRIDRRKGDQL
jgi:hypothetical protein